MIDLRETYQCPSPTVQRITTFLSVFTLVVALGACAERPDADGLESDTSGVTMDSEEMDTSAFSVGASDARADTVEVELREFSIDMPSRLEAGLTVFQVTNNGDIAHNFEVEGQGMEEEFETNLQPGETNALRVDLEEGTYTVYCPVADHQSEGMEMELTVSSGSSTASTY